ncbi:MAG: hypothetical protein E6G97_12065 [Alphaproteobacteria bacterium]|nr:MAG: hypothetical protein E6G97_12065 [Alphaproteobacteria bacterium]
MALYVARDDGTGTIFPNRAFGHLFLAVNIDGGLGETNNLADPKGIQITYARTDGGIPAVRIDTLANELAPTNAAIDIIIFPVSGSFVLNDGTLITSAAGVAVPVGDINNPTAADIVTFYDTSQCNGSGYWVDKEGGGTTTEPPEIILYHELSHCFHFSSGTTAATSAAEEVAAETDENDLRDQQGLPHRNAASHNGGCGGGPTNCCIVVSIATNSAFSPEVNRLRVVRDYLVRRTRVGDEFIDRLLYQYYSFSPEVCRAMAQSPGLGDQIRERWVVPLIFALELAVHAGDQSFDAEAIGRELDRQLGDDRLAARVDAAKAAELVAIVRIALSGSVPDAIGLPQSAAKLLPILRERLAEAEHVRWALLRIVGIWAQAALRRLGGERSRAVGLWVRRELESWLADAPVDEIWSKFGAAEAASELEDLGSSVFRTVAAREGFAARVAARVPRLAPVLHDWSRGGEGPALEKARA